MCYEILFFFMFSGVFRPKSWSFVLWHIRGWWASAEEKSIVQRLFSLKFYNSSRTLMYAQEMKLFRDAMSSWALSLHSHFSLFHSLVFIHQTKLIVNIAKSVESNRILLPISIIKILLVSRLLTNLIQSKFVAVNLI